MQRRGSFIVACRGKAVRLACGRTGWLLAALLVVQGLAAPAGALVFVATNTNDLGLGSLRAAILSANASPGPDEVTFNLAGCPCTITLASSLLVTESLTITGPGAATLGVSGADAVQVLRTTVPGASLTVSDLTVRNGRDPGNGGGIFAAGSLILNRVTVRNSTAPNGGGVFASSDATFTNCRFEDNVATTDGGAVYAAGALTVLGSDFVENQVTSHKGYGGGGAVMAFGFANISDTDFINNTAGDWGGGAYLADFAPTPPPTLLDGVRFIGNTAEDGGGGGLFVWFESELTGVEAIGNYAGYRGGGIYGSFSGNYGLTVTGGILQNNSAAGGGGLYADGDIVVDGTEMTGNVSRFGNGGGMWTPGSATVSNVVVTGNIVLSSGNSGGIDTGTNLTISNSTLAENRNFANSAGGSGAGGNANVTDCEYRDNVAEFYAGGLLAFGTATVSGSRFEGNSTRNVGGAITTTTLNLDSSELVGNAATENWGGGAYAAGTATVVDTLFSGNSAAYAGGGLAVQGAAELTGGRFENNHAGITGWGGGIYANGPSLEIDATEFAGNSAESRGGAAYAAGSLSVTGALIEGNTATSYGGGLYAAGNFDLQRSWCIDNESDRGGAVFQAAGAGAIANSLFARNRALSGYGEALSLQPAGVQTISHSTFATHPTQAGGAALYVNGGTVELRNSIVTNHAQGILQDAGAVTASFNLFDGNGVDTQGAGIVNGDPVAGAPDFVDPANDEYHLTIGSAALDAGPNLGVAADIDGEARPQGTGFDLGFDELSLAAPTGCPVSPAPSCGTAASDALQVAVASDPVKDRFTLKHLRAAGAIAQADFGDPVAGGNAYQLCVYDASAGTPALLGSLVVPGGGTCSGKPCWKAISDKGYQFKDKAATHAGVRQIVLRGGEAGKGALLVKGAGAGLPLPGPKLAGIPYMDADPDVTVQLHESSTGNCWESMVATADVQKNTETQFKATRK